MNFRSAAVLVLSLALLGAGSGEHGLVWHAATDAGEPVGSHRADDPINPASLVKVATTLWALEVLGPGHTFETRFGIRGRIEPGTGVLRGDLVVEGAGDPDFHVENAYLVATALNEAGVREVTGRLVVDDRFWIGWEGGSERRVRDAARRRRIMAGRLGEAFDPRRWTPATKRSVEDFRTRRELSEAKPPRVVVHGSADGYGGNAARRVIVIHRSKPLLWTLKRFNSYSNNDIERLQASLGSPDELATWLAGRRGAAPGRIRLKTLSGLGSNRLTTRQVVHLLGDLARTAGRLEVRLEDLLPVAGCDPGTFRSYPRLVESGARVIGKTGTLLRTDGGVATLAGYVDTAGGRVAFCVGAPNSGRDILQARENEQQWLLRLIDSLGGPTEGDTECPPALPYPDDGANVFRVPEAM